MRILKTIFFLILTVAAVGTMSAQKGDKAAKRTAKLTVKAAEQVQKLDDLIVAAVREDIGSRADAGLVAVVFGPVSGATSTASFAQSDALGGAAESGDNVGYSLDVLDHNGDGHADILIGAPGEDIGSIKNAGLAHLVYGADTGTGWVSGWTQSSFAGGVEANDRFGG